MFSPTIDTIHVAVVYGYRHLAASVGFDTIEFLPDGTYTMVSSQYNPEVPTTGEVVEGHYVVVAFGTYEIED